MEHNPTLTKPITDAVTDPSPLGRLAGDWHDDDAQAIDEYFEEADHGPQQYIGIKPAVEKIANPTRILNVKTPVGNASVTLYDPVQVFPPDLNRKVCNIIADGKFNVGSEKTDVYNGVTFPANTLVTMNGHTGSLWIYSTENSVVNVTISVVTQ